MSSPRRRRGWIAPAPSGIVFIYLGSLLAQIVQVAGYPTLLALALARGGYPSWLIGANLSFQWAVVLFLAPLIPRMITRLGTQSAAQIGVGASAVAPALLLASSSVIAVTASALLMGVGLTIRWVACDTWIVHTVHKDIRGRAIGIHETLIGFGIVIGPLLTMLSAGNEPAALMGYISLLILSAVCFNFGSQAAVFDDDRDRDGGHLAAVLRILALALLAALISGYVETSMVSLLPLYLMSFQYPQADALVLLSVFGLGGALLQAPLGWVADRWSFRAGQVLCLSLIMAGGLLLVATISSPWAVVLILFVWGGCAAGLNTLAVIEAGSTLRAGASTGMALIASSYTLGGVIGPVVSGATLSTAHGHGAVLIISGLMVAYAITLSVAGRGSVPRP